MSRYTDIDLFLQNIEEIYCKNCERRKGMKNGKQKFVYEIGEAPCRCCAVDEMKYEVENAPTADVVPVVRCKDCSRQCICNHTAEHFADWYCADGEKIK